MSINKPTYDIGAGTIRASALLHGTDPAYEDPTDADMRALKQRSGLSASELANLVRVESRTVRKWLAPAGVTNRTQIPYGCWRLLLIELEIIKQ